MHYGNIKNLDVADGPGVRVCLYVSGCRNACVGCHNKCTWDFNYGSLYTEETEKEILSMLSPDFIQGFSLCGGEPMEEENQAVIVGLLNNVRNKYPLKDIWVWTGYEYEDLLPGGRKYTPYSARILSLIDVLVTGRFDIKQRDISDSNRWRGSRNQRVIDVPRSMLTSKKVFVEGIPNNK